MIEPLTKTGHTWTKLQTFSCGQYCACIGRRQVLASNRGHGYGPYSDRRPRTSSKDSCGMIDTAQPSARHWKRPLYVAEGMIRMNRIRLLNFNFLIEECQYISERQPDSYGECEIRVSTLYGKKILSHLTHHSHDQTVMRRLSRL